VVTPLDLRSAMLLMLRLTCPKASTTFPPKLHPFFPSCLMVPVYVIFNALAFAPTAWLPCSCPQSPRKHVSANAQTICARAPLIIILPENSQLSIPLLDDSFRSAVADDDNSSAAAGSTIGSVPDGEEKYFGGKVITLTGGIALLLNNATGPGLVQIPLLFQQSGWLPSVTMFVSSFALSVTAALMLVEATSRIPGARWHMRALLMRSSAACRKL
jgi:hypothetical protein